MVIRVRYISTFIRTNTRYTPKNHNSLSFRPRQSNRTGYPLKTLGFSQSKLFEKNRNISCAVQSPALPSALRFNCADYATTVISINEQHVKHPYHHHCSMVRNVNHNHKKHDHCWYDDSTRGAETPQWWNIQRNVRYIQELCLAWQGKWKDYIFIRFQQRILISLMDSVKDKTRLKLEASFLDGTTRQELLYELEESTTRKKYRKEQKKFRDLWSQLASKYSLKLPGNGIFGWWSLKAT